MVLTDHSLPLTDPIAWLRVLLFGLAVGAGFNVQAALVGSGGYTNAFAAQPPAADWSTFSITGLQAGATVKVKGASISVEASSALELKGATVNINGSGAVNISGGMINLG